MNGLCIDPGIRGCGAALYNTATVGSGGALTAARYILNPIHKGNDLAAIWAAARAVVQWALREVGPWSIDRLVVEWPQVYSGRQRSTKNPNDLLPLAGIDAALFTLLPGVSAHQYLPREWKGTVDPDEMIRRTKSRLSTLEFARAVAALPAGKAGCTCAHQMAVAPCTASGCKWHNVWDAIGIGLKYFGRLEKMRVIHR